MQTTTALHLSFAVLIALFTNCQQSAVNESVFLSIEQKLPPAAVGSVAPNLLAGDDGRVYLSWIEPLNEGSHALRFAVYDQDAWSDASTIAEGDNWFVNWADFPSMTAFENGSLVAHWLPKSGQDTYSYGVNIAFSTNSRDSWGNSIIPHRDGTPTEHGSAASLPGAEFISMLPWTDDQLLAVWLERRNFAEGANGHNGNGSPADAMTLRFAKIGKSGNLSEERLLDQRVCDCCPTSIARTGNGAIVVYRDRSEQEIRDISMVRFHDGQWSQPRRLYEDAWKIEGCPVNGPAVAAEGSQVAVAWFTWANEIANVKVIFSDNEGLEFGEAIIADDGEPMGRVDIILLQDGAALVSWLEVTPDGAEIRVRRIQPDGSRDPSVTVTESSKERSSGTPRMVKNGNEIFLAWTQDGVPSMVRTAVAKLSDE